MLKENNKANKEWNILGCIDDIKGEVSEYPILGDDEYLINYNKAINAVIAVGSPTLKNKIYAKYKNAKNIIFPTIISRHAIVGDSCRYGKGNIICSGVTITEDVVLEDFTTINIGSTICHGSKIGRYTTLAPSCNISGDVNTGSQVDVGVGTKIIQGITVGDQSIIGAGTVVIRNIEGGGYGCRQSCKAN